MDKEFGVRVNIVGRQEVDELCKGKGGKNEVIITQCQLVCQCKTKKNFYGVVGRKGVGEELMKS